ncbi:hypothetical protein TKK_0012172 [Trichogramma kaykai]
MISPTGQVSFLSAFISRMSWSKHVAFIGLLLLALLLGASKSQPTKAPYSWYPKYHLASVKGWMNDPNGLIYHKGYYHAFWQHYPDAPSWGLMHWGHARSRDMLNWEHLPIALAPSLPDDIDGIFSGSAIVKNDKLHLVYTGVSLGNKRQRQMLAVSDSEEDDRFRKLGTVIVRNGSELNFRDPKVWQEADGTYWVIVGTQTPDGRGEVLLYNSTDLMSWTYDRVLARSEKKYGFMWECPDMISLNGKRLLLVNPQGMEPAGYDYQNLYQTGYFVGEWHPGSDYKIEREFREIDHGHDFYAAQTFLAADGRRILIGWLDMWESEFAEKREGWAGQFSLPRELTLNDAGDLEIRPIREVKEARKKRKAATLESSEPAKLSEQADAAGERVFLSGEQLNRNEIVVDFNLKETTCEEFGIQLKGNDEQFEGVKIYVDREKSRLFLERFYPKYNIERSSRSVPIDLSKPELSLDIFIDSSSIEVFVNDGQAVMSSRIYPNEDQRQFSMYGTKGSLILKEFNVYDL